jgi:hypothetical protein
MRAEAGAVFVAMPDLGPVTLAARFKRQVTAAPV